LRLCSDVDKNVQTDVGIAHDISCISFAEGVVQGVEVESTYANAVGAEATPKPFCLSDGVDNGQLVRIALKYIRDHPEEDHKLSAVLLVFSWQAAFPCTSPK
jgi:hypothetical protein